MSTVLAISDMHAPWYHRDTVAFLKALKRRYRPDLVVCLGDEGDQYGISDYDHAPEAPSAGDEYTQMIEALNPVYNLFPVVRSCVSNHTSRPFRRASKYGIPSVYLRSYKDFMQAPKEWEWVDSIEIDGVEYFHGEGYSGAMGALKAALDRMQPVVMAHLHAYAGVLYSANSKHLVFGVNGGCLVDRSSIAFQYGKHIAAKPIIGCPIIKDGIPSYIHMQMDRHGRWNGEL